MRIVMAKRGALKRHRIEYSADGSIARITYEFYQFDPADKPNNTCEVFNDLLQVQGYYKKTMFNQGTVFRSRFELCGKQPYQALISY